MLIHLFPFRGQSIIFILLCSWTALSLPACEKGGEPLLDFVSFENFSISPDAETPNPWSCLEQYQGTMTREKFEKKLKTLFDPFDALKPYLSFDEYSVTIRPEKNSSSTPQFVLQFACDENSAAPAPRRFRTPEEIQVLSKPADQPLYGLRIAIDPGHIGGDWAQMEGRSTSYRGSRPVKEGDLNLITAAILKKELLEKGATVYVVRNSTDPVTPFRPKDFVDDARQMLLAQSPALSRQPRVLENRLRDLSELLFYRSSEIAERGYKIKNEFQPDLILTLYLDATPGSGGGHLTKTNRNIFFVHGCYSPKEVEDPRQRLRLIYKILEDSSAIEIQVASAISQAFLSSTHYPAVLYGNSATTRLVDEDNPYVVARNLAANRNYDGPVVCTEPYFMNNIITYQRLLAGDYEGTKVFGGKAYQSIFQEYAAAVLEGLIKCYGPSLKP